MSYLDRDTYGMYKNNTSGGPGPDLLGADTLIGNDVCNQAGEDLGDIKELMIDTRSGRVSYAVLSFGGFLGMGEKLFAVPWGVLKLDTVNERFILDMDKDRLEHAPGFDKDHWPDMADQNWTNEIDTYYGRGANTDLSSGYTDNPLGKNDLSTRL
ncbi:PRC-barrel domain-containing protein [Glaciimonas immobilis]|uniref:Sporulation protein YlmC with PRC-barrel domain n=1 Tax=Glaciimonas immobilis TaxID=728004 RepID=A0A840RX39_9BURK|nr:PRC-barrel domain-containing protein [Glaciimonas immobilis]KAF3996321.1 PRC-barrel domain containing protein [Glaciimonas immobilis]MBB5202153.1 sporulation protein YlmC with PRC-barrel domain [Glaciimonas immobilis]